jgi:NAD(P)-dependent dehydrogenase (short-subunit alcohol dehydrogenase family)
VFVSARTVEEGDHIFSGSITTTVRAIHDAGGSADIVAADLGKAEDRERLVATTGPVDVLVNNAAITSPFSLVDTTPEQYEQVVAINQTAPFFLMQAAIPEMVKVGGGAIVNITSIAAMRGQGGKGCTAYAASKSALVGIMTDVVDAYGPEGIRVNCVAPGIIDTPMRSSVMRASGIDPATIDLGARVPLRREGDAWDIARMVRFLVGPEGHYITGVLIPVDGGKTSTSH